MGSYTGTVPTLLSGESPSGAKFQEFINFMTAMTAGWTTYTPSWAASAGTPAIGNGTLIGRYRRIGKTVDFQLQLTAGSTTTYGTAGAFWYLSVPPVGNAAAQFHGAGHALDQGVNEYQLSWRLSAGTGSLEFMRETGRFLNNNVFVFGNTDVLTASGTYEIV
jgi:hypothetical protein